MRMYEKNGHLCKGIGVRYQMIDTEKKAYPTTLLCDVMEVSRSGYYSWRSQEKSSRQREYENLLPVVLEAHRISKEVEELGIPCGRTKAGTLMKLANVSAKQKKKFKVTTDSKHSLPVAPNLLNREFEVQIPRGTLCLSDVKRCNALEGGLFVSIVYT